MAERESFIENTKQIDERLEALKQLYPEVFSEGKINLNAFKDITNTSNLPPEEDKTPGYYGLYWPGKRKAKQLAKKEAEGTLEPVPGDGVDEDSTHNVYIEGDNLEVLRILRQSYKGRVKMIYIDPPYNTGNDFIYPDDYSMPVEEYLKLTGQTDESGKKLVSNAKSNGAFHTNWLNMMYPRLQLARELLAEDGVIFISIDDNEQANLKLLCDDIFGEENFVGELIIETATDNNPSQIITQHEYMTCYARSKENVPKWNRTSEAAELIKSQYLQLKNKGLSLETIQTELRAWIKRNKDNLPQVAHYNNVDGKGVYSSSSNSSNPHPGGYMFDIEHPITHKPCPKPINGWRWPEETFKKYVQEGEVEWGIDHSTQPHVKKRIETAFEQLRSIIYEDNRASTKNLEDLFGGVKVFDNPKPVSILYKLIDYVTEKNDIIIDFFAGSSSTAEAMIKLNNDDYKNRKFIMVQLPVDLDESLKTAKGDNKKQIENSIEYLVSINKNHNICELGKQRIRLAGKKIKKMDSSANLDIGFKVYRLNKSNFKKYTPVSGQDQTATNTLFGELEGNLIPLVDGWREENVLTEIILWQGFALDCKVEKLTNFTKNTIYKIVDSPDAVSKKIKLYVCLDSKLAKETIESLALGDDEKFICLDSAIDDTSYARLSDKGKIETI